MAVASDWLGNAWLEWAYLGTSTATQPTAWYLALFDDAGNEITTSVDANYARQTVSFETFATPRRVRSAVSVSFPAAEDPLTADYIVAEFAVFDAATAGNRLQREALDFPKTITGGDVLTFAAGDLIMGVD